VQQARTRIEQEVPRVSNAALEALESDAKRAPRDGHVLLKVKISQHVTSVKKEKQPRGRVQQVVATVILVSMEVLQEFVRNVQMVNSRTTEINRCPVSHVKKVKFQTTKKQAANHPLGKRKQLVHLEHSILTILKTTGRSTRADRVHSERIVMAKKRGGISKQNMVFGD
jgi:hypothetical protein